MDPVVDAAWLSDHRDAVVVCDIRWYLDGRSGADAYAGGHIPGAVFVDLDTDLCAKPSATAGRHPLPEPDAFAAAMGRLGIAGDDLVVAYDDAGGACAARLVWMLRVTGHDAALLDGGLATWHGPLETAAPARTPARFDAVPWPAEHVADSVGAASAAVLVDARAAERYRGEVEPVDPRAGHIPGAVSLPLWGNLDADGRFLPPDALRARFEAAGIRAGGDTVVYCGSGVSACHNVLALERAGLGPARLYPGSWSQWSADPSRPVATGDG
jgi:thiosulfate/3-mercaptopyruvate sulfurtransferase